MQYTKSWQLRNAEDEPLRIQSTYDVHCDSPATTKRNYNVPLSRGASKTEIDDVNQSREIHSGGTGKTKQCTDFFLSQEQTPKAKNISLENTLKSTNPGIPALAVHEI